MPKFLFKANNDVLSHCACDGEPAMSTTQLDCPWCGCGWLFSCSKCKKAFTYAVVKETDLSLVELGRREVESRGLTGKVTEDDIAEWAEAMAADINRFDIGQVVVYLDGTYFPVDAKDVSFDGYFAHHEFSTLPHADALEHPDALSQAFSDPQYWIERELADADA